MGTSASVTGPTRSREAQVARALRIRRERSSNQRCPHSPRWELCLLVPPLIGARYTFRLGVLDDAGRRFLTDPEPYCDRALPDRQSVGQAELSGGALCTQVHFPLLHEHA